MNATRYNAITDGLSSVARKVLTCVPIKDSWSVTQIHSELTRSTSSHLDRHTLLGCLKALKDSGLVKERPGSLFQQIQPPEPHIRQEQPADHEGNRFMQTPKPVLTSVPVTAAKDTSFDRGADLARRLRQIGV